MVMGDMELNTELLVIGGGPGGYSAAFRAADLGLEVTLVDTRRPAGGVCLHEGCIPSKSLLYLAELIDDAARAERMGVTFARPAIDLAGIRAWKDSVVESLARGIELLIEKRSIQFFCGKATFLDNHTVRLSQSEISRIRFRQAIIASGSTPVMLPGTSFCGAGRIMDSGQALQLADIPGRLLIIGGGYIGVELGMVYHALGSSVSLIERERQLLPGVDRDLVVPLQDRLAGDFEEIILGAPSVRLEERKNDVLVRYLKDKGEVEDEYDRVLVAVGRQPNSRDLGLEQTLIQCDQRGFVRVDEQQRTTEPHIFAIGDVVGGLMLAHKAGAEGKVAAEVAAGRKAAFDFRAIPAIIYTDPQIGWCGLSEAEAARSNIAYTIHSFPWRYSGRAHTMGRTEGVTKLLIDPANGRILGCGAVGRQVEGIIAEAVVAIEMGAVADDLALSLHPHPSLSETEFEAAELFSGHATHMLLRNAAPDRREPPAGS